MLNVKITLSLSAADKAGSRNAVDAIVNRALSTPVEIDPGILLSLSLGLLCWGTENDLALAMLLMNEVTLLNMRDWGCGCLQRGGIVQFRAEVVVDVAVGPQKERYERSCCESEINFLNLV